MGISEGLKENGMKRLFSSKHQPDRVYPDKMLDDLFRIDDQNGDNNHPFLSMDLLVLQIRLVIELNFKREQLISYFLGSSLTKGNDKMNDRPW